MQSVQLSCKHQSALSNSISLRQRPLSCSHCTTQIQVRIKDECNFNYEIVIDVVQLNGISVLHVIGTGTSFQSARFLKSLSARDTWDALYQCWIHVSQGSPDHITHDLGTNFALEELSTSVVHTIHISASHLLPHYIIINLVVAVVVMAVRGLIANAFSGTAVRTDEHGARWLTLPTASANNRALLWSLCINVHSLLLPSLSFVRLLN
jgi:hypothetical protein